MLLYQFDRVLSLTSLNYRSPNSVPSRPSRILFNF